MNNHKNKHVRAAVDYALEHGWRLVLAGPRAHVWGKLYCPLHDRSGRVVDKMASVIFIPHQEAAR